MHCFFFGSPHINCFLPHIGYSEAESLTIWLEVQLDVYSFKVHKDNQIRSQLSGYDVTTPLCCVICYNTERTMEL